MLREVIDDGINGIDFTKFHEIYTSNENNAWLYIESMPKEKFYQFFQKYCKQSEVLFYLNDAGEVVGHCRLVKKTGSHEHVVEIGAVAIDPKFHGKGYGKKMLAEVKEWIEKNKGNKHNYENICRIELSYEADNPVAMIGKGEFYLKCGFETEGYLDDWYQRDTSSQYKNFNFPNPTREIFANYMTKLGKQVLHKTVEHKSINWLNSDSTFFECRLAQELDVNVLVKLYDSKSTDYSYLDIQERKAVVLAQIKNNSIFVVINSDNDIVAACQVEPQEGRIDQDAVISNIIASDNLEAVKCLFDGVINHYLENRSKCNVRRLELNLPSCDSITTEVLTHNGFEHTGSQKIKFKDTDNNYWDEHLFQYTLFNVEDAIAYLQNRITAENNLAKQNKSFSVPLQESFAVLVQQQLHELQQIALTYPQQHAVYKLIRTLCTQDYIPISARLDYCKELKNLREVKNLTDFQTLINQCISYLDNREKQPIASQAKFMFKQQKTLDEKVSKEDLNDRPSSSYQYQQ